MKIIYLMLSSCLISCWSKNNELNNIDKPPKTINFLKKDKNTDKVSNYNQEISFDGKWEWKSEDSTSSFQLRIIQTGQELKAQYCAVQYSGNRMDCDFDTNFNIRGKIKGNKAIVKFNSFYGAKDGEATLTIDKDKLIWKITKWPLDKDCFAPEEAVLKLKK